MEELFLKKVEEVRNLTYKPENEELLELYAFFKQSTEGNCTKDEPSYFNLKERAKYFEWKKIENMEKEMSMKLYVKLVDKLLDKN
jgi:diazepam-binding inhibitor (GABA receptor modulator, acyl-CoA-binding protein)